MADLIRVAGAKHLMMLDPHTPQLEGFFSTPVDALKVEPFFCEWIKKNRPACEGLAPAKVEPFPETAIIVKEMYTPPASRCREAYPDRSVENLKPQHGIAYMVRDSKASFDGWFWGYFGFFDSSSPDPNIDWPPPQPPARPLNQPAYAGFGQYF